jgi:hypothetical protein
VKAMQKSSFSEQVTQLEGFSIEDLEKAKLHAETQQIEKAISSSANEVFRKATQNWLALVLAFLTLASGIYTFYSELNAFLKEKRLERQISFSKEMLGLVQQLNSEKKDERENAFLLLGYFKMDAVPILLYHLEKADDPAMVIRSLKLIQKNTERPEELTDRVLKAGRAVFKIQDVTQDETISSYSNIIKALGEIGGERKNKIVEILKDLQKDIDADKPTRKYDPLEIDLLKEDIDDALKKLGFQA